MRTLEERKAKYQELWDRRTAGEETKLLAAEIGITSTTLRHHWKKHLGVSPKALVSYPNEWVEATWARFQGGESAFDIAESLGMEENALRSTWRRNGKYTNRVEKEWTTEEAQETWDERQSGVPTKVIAERLEVSPGTLCHAWERHLGKRLQGSGFRRDWTKRELNETWARRQEGERTADIGASLDPPVKAGALRAAWRREGFRKIPPRYDVLSPELVEALWERRKAGETGQALAEEVGVPPSTLFSAWKKRGWSAKDEYRKRTKFDALPLWNMRKRKLTWPQICVEQGLEPTLRNQRKLEQRLRRYCKKHGIVRPERL